jgi:hypothetical protein
MHVDHRELGRGGIGHKIQADALIKTHKSAAVRNGKLQQITVGDLAGGHLSCKPLQALIRLAMAGSAHQAPAVRVEDRHHGWLT